VNLHQCFLADTGLPIHQRHFSGFVGRKQTFIEIGTIATGNAAMWRRHFGLPANT
jgi:hypothetical protein